VIYALRIDINSNSQSDVQNGARGDDKITLRLVLEDRFLDWEVDGSG
jgi:hypothetical protein